MATKKPQRLWKKIREEIRLKREVKRHVFERDGKCLKCGTMEDLTVDHIVPESQGGPYTVHNLQTLCSTCNEEKDTQTIDYRKFKVTGKADINRGKLHNTKLKMKTFTNEEVYEMIAETEGAYPAVHYLGHGMYEFIFGERKFITGPEAIAQVESSFEKYQINAQGW